MSVTYPAVVKYAPVSVTKVAEGVLRPEIARDLAAVTARPAAIRKITATRVTEVIEAIRNVEALAGLLAGKDQRLSTRRAIAQHPMYRRAELLLATRNHPWKDWDLDQVVEHVSEKLTHRGISRMEMTYVVSWCRALAVGERARAYQALLILFGSRNVLCVDLVLDVAAGYIPGLDLQACLISHPGTVERPMHLPQLTHPALSAALTGYSVIDLSLAMIAVDNTVPIPVRSVETITDEAVEHLLLTSSAVELVEQGVVTDPQRLIAIVDRLQPMVRGRLARIISDPKVVAVLIDGLTYRARPNAGDLADLLDRVPDLPFEARKVALSHANAIELRDFINGRQLNTPRPGEVSWIIDHLLATQGDSSEGWYHTSLPTTIQALGLCSPSGAVLEGIDRLIDTYPGLVKNLLQDEGLVGRRTVDHLRALIGEDPEVWEMLLRLAGDWSGTLDELAAAATLL